MCFSSTPMTCSRGSASTRLNRSAASTGSTYTVLNEHDPNWTVVTPCHTDSPRVRSTCDIRLYIYENYITICGMRARHIVVVGASLSGVRTVEALRRHEVEARISLIGDEAELPYERPPLSKDVLLGKADADAVRLATRESLEAMDVELRLGTPAVGLDVDARELTLADGTLRYDEVVIATGAAAIQPPFATELPGVHVLRTLADALAIRDALERAPRIVVVGGGFIGAEVASAARELGLEVTIVDVAPVLMQRALGPVLAARMTELVADAGVALRLGCGVREIVGSECVEAVRLTDGSTLPADLVVVGVGAAPNVAWLARSGLDLADGVGCDEYLCAAPGVYAVGDAARWHHPHYGRTMRCEHWTAATEHADAVAATLSGAPTACDGVPYVWSDQFGGKLQIAGVVQPDDEIRFVVDEPGRFLALTGSSGVQHAAVALNAPAALIRQRMKLARNPAWPPESSAVEPAAGERRGQVRNEADGVQA